MMVTELKKTQSNPSGNLAVEYLFDIYPDLSLEDNLKKWFWMCGELTDAVGWWLDSSADWKVLYVSPRKSIEGRLEPNPKLFVGRPTNWSFHIASVVDGLVHDPWFPTLVLPVDEYAKLAFDGQEVTAEIR